MQVKRRKEKQWSQNHRKLTIKQQDSTTTWGELRK